MSALRSVCRVAWFLVLVAGCGGGGDDQPSGPMAGTGVVTAGSSAAGSMAAGSSAAGSTAAGSGAAGSTAAGTGSAAGSGAPDDTFDAGTAADRNDVAPGELCERLATIQCAGEAACCDAPTRDFAACKTAATASCGGTLMLDMVAGDARVGFDQAAASTAFAELERRAAACEPSIAAWALSSDGFAGSFTGTIAADGNCEPEGGLGAASVAELSAALASCSRAANLACMPSDTGATCVARSAQAGACFTDLNCVDGLYCENPNGDFTGVCTARKAAAAECMGANECSSFICKGGRCAADGDAQAVYCLE